MIDSRDFLFEFRETRDRVCNRKLLITGLQVLGCIVAAVGWLWMVIR